MSWDKLEPLLTDSSHRDDSLQGARCSVCHDLNYLPVLESGNPSQLKKQMALYHLTESRSLDTTNFANNHEWPAEEKPQYPSIPRYIESARSGCRCCAFVHILYCSAIPLIPFATVNGWGPGTNDEDIHALAFRVHGTIRLRLTNAKCKSRLGRDLDWDVYSLASMAPVPPLTTAPCRRCSRL